MPHYFRESRSKTEEEHLKEIVRVWNYEKQWLKLVPKEGTNPLSFDELKDLRDKLPENRQFCFARTVDNAVTCDNKHGGLLLIRHGYVPVF